MAARLPKGWTGDEPVRPRVSFSSRFVRKVRRYDESCLDSGIALRLRGSLPRYFPSRRLPFFFPPGILFTIRAINLLKPKRVLPIHYNTWELIAQDAGHWATRVRKKTKAKPIV